MYKRQLLHRDSVQLLMARNQDVALRLAETLAHRLSKAEGVIAGLGLKDVGQRLARELLLLAEHGDVTDAGVVIKIPVPWAEVAARIGTTPETPVSYTHLDVYKRQVLKPLGIPADVLPLIITRPISGSGALAVTGDILRTHGPDTPIGLLASILQGATDTTFYVVTLYFGSVGIRKSKHALAACLIGDFFGFLTGFIIWKMMIF